MRAGGREWIGGGTIGDHFPDHFFCDTRILVVASTLTPPKKWRHVTGATSGENRPIATREHIHRAADWRTRVGQQHLLILALFMTVS